MDRGLRTFCWHGMGSNGKSGSVVRIILVQPKWHAKNLLMCVPSSFGRFLSSHHPLVIKPFPLSTSSLDYYLYWHRDQEHSPPLAWLRGEGLSVDPRLNQRRIGQLKPGLQENSSVISRAVGIPAGLFDYSLTGF